MFFFKEQVILVSNLAVFNHFNSEFQRVFFLMKYDGTELKYQIVNKQQFIYKNGV